jgi:hypothetical protein
MSPFSNLYPNTNFTLTQNLPEQFPRACRPISETLWQAEIRWRRSKRSERIPVPKFRSTEALFRMEQGFMFCHFRATVLL